MAFQRAHTFYGIELQSTAPLSQLDFELAAFKLCRDGHTEGLLGAEQHFINASEILWPVGCSKPFVWHDQARMLLHRYCTEKVLAVTGHGSSSKTALSAIWSLVNVFADPNDVMVICVSTDIEGASQSRIYGQIKDFFAAVPGKMHFKLNQSAKTLAPYDPNKLVRFSSSAGIKLVSGNANKEKEAEGKIKGYKIGGINPGKIILIIDEGCDVAAGVYKTYFSNLAGNPRATLIALANYRPNNAFADLAEPVGGWNTIEASDQFWRTQRGACIHLDGLQSPNWLAQDDIYPFLQSYTHVQSFYDRGQEDSPEFWEQVRAFPAPVGVGEVGIYDEAEIRMYDGDRPVLDKEWADKPIPFSGTDPAFVEGGDKAMHAPGRCGMLKSGIFAIEWLEPIAIPIKAGEGNKAAEYQILNFMLDWSNEYGVDKELMGYDSTDHSFKTLFQANGGKDFCAVPFHGGATDRVVMKPIGKTSYVKNSDYYSNRVSEIWGVGREFLRAGQLRGIRGQFKIELTTRHWNEKLSINQGRKLKGVESKREMKKRMKRRSPDTADACLIGLDTLIVNFKLKVGQGPFTLADREALRKKMIARGQISARRLRSSGGSGSFAHGLFPGHSIRRQMPADLSKLKLL